MSKSNDFNIFEVLSKDDKELIHSAFLAFLMPRYDFIKNELLGDSFGKIEFICTEVSYKYSVEPNRQGQPKSGKKSVRFDIFVRSEDDSEICIIENKFKCIPTKKQLATYSNAIQENFEGKKVRKVLICFSDSLANILPKDWFVISYQKIHELVNKIEDFQCKKEEFFIKDYLFMLDNYLKKYQFFKKEGLFDLFKNPTKEDNRFWLRLILSEILKNLHKYKNEFNRLDGPSMHSIPIIDLYSPNLERKENKYNFLIQLKGSRIEFYCHYWNGADGKALVEDKIQILNNNNLGVKESGAFKTGIKTGGKSMYVYQENIIKEMKKEDFTFENIELYIVDFLNRLVAANG